MKIQKSIHSAKTFLFAVVLPLNGVLSCAVPQTNDMQTQSKRVLLKVETITSETCYPRGDLTDILLYEDMETEFDFYLVNTPERVGLQFQAERRKAKLNEVDFEKLRSFLSRTDLLYAASSYSSRRLKPMSVDSKVRHVITFRHENQEKEITLEEDDCHLYLSETPASIVAKPNVYPKSLISLLELVDDVNRELRKQIDPNSR